MSPVTDLHSRDIVLQRLFYDRFVICKAIYHLTWHGAGIQKAQGVPAHYTTGVWRLLRTFLARSKITENLGHADTHSFTKQSASGSRTNGITLLFSLLVKLHLIAIMPLRSTLIAELVFSRKHLLNWGLNNHNYSEIKPGVACSNS